MAANGLLPFRPPVEPDVDAEFVTLDDAGVLFEALSSTTARAILTELYEAPRPASEIAERVETSMQNVGYHLTKLREAGLVEVADTWYSSKGVEMNVYAPANDPLVLFAGEPESEPAMDELEREVELVTDGGQDDDRP